jgi:selenocysteine-specific translation elongation factor
MGVGMIIAVLSDNPERRKEVCRGLGNESGEDDISFYSVNFGGKIKTIIEPTLYPQKIQPLIYSIYAADFVVFVADALNQFVGEIIIALDALKKERGVIISQLQLPVKGTVLEGYQRFSTFEEAKDKILNAELEESGASELFALVDKAFQVKSVGNVALGIVKEGKIKKHDRLLFFPGKKEVEVKSIQINDKDVEECGEGSRFGISYKGDEIGRGQLFSLRVDNKFETSVLGRFEKSPFFKEDLNRKMHACLNFQFLECRVADAELKCDAPLAYRKHDRIIVLDPSNQKLRVAGVFVAQ